MLAFQEMGKLCRNEIQLSTINSGVLFYLCETNFINKHRFSPVEHLFDYSYTSTIGLIYSNAIQ